MESGELGSVFGRFGTDGELLVALQQPGVPCVRNSGQRRWRDVQQAEACRGITLVLEACQPSQRNAIRASPAGASHLRVGTGAVGRRRRRTAADAHCVGARGLDGADDGRREHVARGAHTWRCMKPSR